MGGHYNPDGVDHGDLKQGHVGDLENVVADDSGVANFTITAKRVDLIGDRSVIGRGLVIHEDEDDLGKGGDAESLKTGNAGERLACGVIVVRSNENK
jgi:Cu-Zn family superoxide dismutase